MNKRLYVGNLEYATTEDEMKELFSSYGTVVYSRIIKRQDGKSRGFGFVEMETEEEAKEAAEKLNQSEFKSRTIVVNEARESEKRSFNSNDGGYNSRRQNRRGGNDDNLDAKLRSLRRKFNR